jgi:iron uptake system component EfeO
VVPRRPHSADPAHPADPAHSADPAHRADPAHSADPAHPADPAGSAAASSFPRRRPAVAAVAVAAVAVVAAACSSSGKTDGAAVASSSGDGGSKTVHIVLTSAGCRPKPAKVPTGQIEFDVRNASADAVSEAELRTHDLSHILGEQENLTPGLSGGFSLVVQPGKYVINCPGAAHQHAPFTVTGTSHSASWKSDPVLNSAVTQYGAYVRSNVARLVTATQSMCEAIDAGDLQTAQQRYARARVLYERIEPVAEVWGSLDTAIDGRLGNPVTSQADFHGFHRIEQLMWADNTLSGAPAECTKLVANQIELRTLVDKAGYDPVTMASGATDLINEAATAKITGEEERYSNTDFIVFQANVDAAMEVAKLLAPALQKTDPSVGAHINQRDQAVEHALDAYRATPGYDDTGYVEYSQVLDAQRRQLSATVQAFAESLSKMSGQV